MARSLPSHNHQRRVKRVAVRLVELLHALDLPKEQRRMPLPAEFAGRARRTLGEAEELFGGDLLPPEGTRSPGDLFVSTLANLQLVEAYKTLVEKRYSR